MVKEEEDEDDLEEEDIEIETTKAAPAHKVPKFLDTEGYFPSLSPMAE